MGGKSGGDLLEDHRKNEQELTSFTKEERGKMAYHS